MNNMNFRRQMNCQNCDNCNCRSQQKKPTPDCDWNNKNIEPRIENGCCNRQMAMPYNDNKHICQTNINPHNCDCHHDKNMPHENCAESISHVDMHNIPIGIGYVPWQQWRKIFALCDGLSQGTIFKELAYPFYGCIPNGFCSQKGGTK